MQKLPEAKVVAVDTETTGLDVHHKAEGYSIGFCDDEGERSYVRWVVDPFTRKVHYNRSEIKRLQTWFADESRTLVFVNAPFDVAILEKMGVPVPGLERVEDAMIGFHTCRTAEGDWEAYSLKNVSAKYLNYPSSDEKDLRQGTINLRKTAKALEWKIHTAVAPDFWIVGQLNPLDYRCEEYLMNDAERTMLLWLAVQHHLQELGREESYEFEMKTLFPVIQRMKGRGMDYHPDRNSAMIKRFQRQREKVRKPLAKMAGRPDFNPNSTPQLGEFLFKKEKLPVLSLTEKGNPSTSSDSLAKYPECKAIKLIKEWRQADKAITGFFNQYEKAAVFDDGRWKIKPNIRQHGKKTGRFSSADPNMQGAADMEGGRGDSKIPARASFGPYPGWFWVIIDYNQLEVRTFAAASQYQKLIDILLEGRDLHTEATNGIWGGRDNGRAVKAAMAVLERKTHPPEGHTSLREAAIKLLRKFDYDIVELEAASGLKTSRNKGKPFFFTRMFGGGKKSISAKLNCSYDEADELIGSYDATLPGVIQYVRQAEKVSRQKGYVTTLYGRQLDLPIDEERKASPFIVQGTAADVIKRAMIDCEEYLNRLGMPSEDGLIMQIHDELIFRLPVWTHPRVARKLGEIMERQGDAIGIPCPVKVKMVGPNGTWAEPIDLCTRTWRKEQKTYEENTKARL